jgi:hypothetical protein
VLTFDRRALDFAGFPDAATSGRSKLARLLRDELILVRGEPPMLLGFVEQPSPHQVGRDSRGQRPQASRLAFVMLA